MKIYFWKDIYDGKLYFYFIFFILKFLGKYILLVIILWNEFVIYSLKYLNNLGFCFFVFWGGGGGVSGFCKIIIKKEEN